MKIVLGFILTTFLFVNYAKSQNASKILWDKEKPLEWKDFSGKAQKMDGIDAWTAFIVEPIIKEGKSYVNCYFDKKNSYRIRKKETEYLLRHEQYHFNIAELYARKIRKEVIEKKIRLDSKEFAKLFKSIFKDLEKAQKAYDKDTNHSKIKEEEIRWENDIDKQLEELKDFSNPMIAW